MRRTFFLSMTLNQFFRISLIMDWLWRSRLVTCRSIRCFRNSFMKYVPFAVCSLDPSQTRRSMTPKSSMNYLSPCPDRLFFSMGYTAAKKESLMNTCVYRLLSRDLYLPAIVYVNIILLMRGCSKIRLALYRMRYTL